jgi:hypothetical protein
MEEGLRYDQTWTSCLYIVSSFWATQKRMCANSLLLFSKTHFNLQVHTV